MIGQRQGIIVYIQSLKQVKLLRKFGNIHYVSKKLKYVVVYVDMDDVEGIVARLKKLNYVKNIDVSYRPYVKTEYENKKDKKEELGYSAII